MKPKVAVVIVIWNGIEDTLECLHSLRLDTYPNKEVVIVDNGSTDGSAEQILDIGVEVTLLRSETNTGFTGGNNLGLAHALQSGTRYAFLLNNDTTLEPDALSQLVEAAERLPGAGILAPVMRYYHQRDEVWFSGSRLNLNRAEAYHDNFELSDLPKHAYVCPWVSGCSMLVRMIAVEHVGGFDDRFYLTWEDVDWCVRMNSSGWDVLVVPYAQIFHKGGRSGAKLSGIHSYYAVRNSLLLASKHAGLGYLQALFYVLARHMKTALRAGFAAGKPIAATVWEGFQDHLLGHYGPRKSTRSATSPPPPIRSNVAWGEEEAHADCPSK